MVHADLRQVGIEIQVEAVRSAFNAAQQQVLHGVEADGAQAQGVLHGVVDPWGEKSSMSRSTRTNSRLPRWPILASSCRRSVAYSSGNFHPAKGAAWSRAPVFRSNNGR